MRGARHRLPKMRQPTNKARAEPQPVAATGRNYVNGADRHQKGIHSDAFFLFLGGDDHGVLKRSTKEVRRFKSVARRKQLIIVLTSSHPSRSDSLGAKAYKRTQNVYTILLHTRSKSFAR